MKFKGKALKAIIGVLVSVAIIAWLFYAIDWNEVLTQLTTVRYIYFIPVFLIILLQFVLRTFRWKYLVPDKSTMPFGLSFDGIMIGNFVNYILPLRAGEIFRPIFLSTKSNNSFSNCFAALVIERFFDLSMVLIMFSFSLMGAANLPNWVNQGATALLFLALLILIYIILVMIFPKLIRKFTNICLTPIPSSISNFLEHFLNGLFEGAEVIKDKKNLFMVVILSMLVWIVTAWQYYMLLLIFDGIQATYYQGVLITVIIALAVAAPSAPGFLGVFQAACILAFHLIGLDKESATTYALLSHLQMYIFVIGYGVFLMFKYGLKISDLKTSKNS